LAGFYNHIPAYNNVHIIGSNISASQANTTFTENIIAKGDISASGDLFVGGQEILFAADSPYRIANRSPDFGGLQVKSGSTILTETSASAGNKFFGIGTTEGKIPKTLTVAGDISASGAFYGKQYHMTYHYYTWPSTALQYIPLGSEYEGTSITNQRHWIAPFDGELKRVMLYSTTDGGVTIVGFHKNKNTTAQDTDTVDMDATTTATFNFSSSFSAGDQLSISVDPTSGMNSVNVTCVWLYNTIPLNE